MALEVKMQNQKRFSLTKITFIIFFSLCISLFVFNIIIKNMNKTYVDLLNETIKYNFPNINPINCTSFFINIDTFSKEELKKKAEHIFQENIQYKKLFILWSNFFKENNIKKASVIKTIQTICKILKIPCVELIANQIMFFYNIGFIPSKNILHSYYYTYLNSLFRGNKSVLK